MSLIPKKMNREECIIYVPLLDEGTDVWRPVKAEELEDDLFRIKAMDDYNSADENWRFKPGEIVRCKRRILSGGNVLVAVELVSRGC